MVRLKVIISIMCPSQKYRFQFLMVRLKVRTYYKYTVKPGLFQFLMVRLKVTDENAQIAIMVISIPYGAIKS